MHRQRRNLSLRNWLVMACGLLVMSSWTVVASAQTAGVLPQSLYGSNRLGRPVNRSFGSEGRSPGSNYASRLPGLNRNAPTLSSRAAFNRPTRSNSPVLSPYLNLLPGATDTFGGQYLLRTQVFERAARQENLIENEIQNLQRGSRETVEALDGLGAPLQPIQSGLTTTGHRVGFLSTGSYFPGR